MFSDAPVPRIRPWISEHQGGGVVRMREAPLPADLCHVDTATLLASHAKVLSIITGERDVVVGLRLKVGTDALPCRLSVVDGQWQTLLDQASDAEALAARSCEVSLDELRVLLRGGGPLFTTVLDLADPAKPPVQPDDDVVLVMGLHREGGRPVLRLTYRVDVVDSDSADRLIGYHLRALAAIVENPSAAHHRQTLLPEEELRLQLHGIAGERFELPDRRFHELFTERAAASPDAVALSHRGRQWTYRDIELRSNRIANGLLDRGLGNEDVVAVVSERTAEWLAAIIAIFKAGGAYLPVDSAFPAERITTILRRSDCHLVLTQRQDMGNLADAIGGPVWQSAPLPATVTIEDAATGADHPPEVTVPPDNLAYIYFTSGSTGKPTGAMCEHAGMLNHLFAKVRDLDIGVDDAVVQNAPQCFDISLWQLLAPLLTGGRTVIIDQEASVDTRRFLDEIIAAAASILQVVPSYLELLMSFLDDFPSDLGRLRSVVVTGQAIKKDLVQRWFAKYRIPLVNAYGATEASDDTTHAVMYEVPQQDLVPLGAPVHNVHVYVLDEHLSLVPLGAPGEIAFSGVCVGRGYVNDEERTRLAFVHHPYQRGRRMYRTGDFGRWLPDGNLEFLGRRDEQVKVRGFRIEFGEIEDRMLRLPGVRDAAVVVEDGADRVKKLVAFYSASQPVSAGRIRERLVESLPEYMVPNYFHRLQTLPLTANGKIDKKALAALAETLGHGGAPYVAPRTAGERRIATVWAEVLNVPLEKIGRGDHFFDLGGNSLSAVRFVVKLDRVLSLKDLASSPVLADLAAVLDGRGEHGRDWLLALSSDMVGTTASIVCFPYAAGNAVNFQAFAKALAVSGLAVYGVELPGHDLGKSDEPLRGVTEIAEQVTAEIMRRVTTPIILLGNSAGSAHALAVARSLADQGADLRRIFLVSRFLPTEDQLRAEIAEADALVDSDVKALLSAARAYVELDGGSEDRTNLLGTVYRHDVVSAAEFLLKRRRHSPGGQLDVPVTVLVAEDDPATAGYEMSYGSWRAFSSQVELATVPEGGHYLMRTRPTEVAAAVLRTLLPAATASMERVAS